MSVASLSPTRRELLAAAAAVGAISMLPGTLHAATGGEFNPPFHSQLPAGGDRRATPAHRCHALARARAGVRRSFPADLVDPGAAGDNARRATRHDAETHPVLGNGIRLEQVRGAPEGVAAFRHRTRRAGHPLHPREIEASGCAAGHHHAWLARFGHRTAEDHRSAHQPHCPWRHRGRGVRCRDPVDAGLRLFRQADRNRLGSEAHREGVDRADEAPRLRPVCRAGRRLGSAHHRTDGPARASRVDRHPHAICRGPFRPRL